MSAQNEEPVRSVAPVDQAEIDELSESRRMPRFIPLTPITGIFCDVRVAIVQLSETGLRIQHSHPLRLGTEGKLHFVLVRASASYAIKARVVWSRLTKIKTAHGDAYISGLKLVENQLVLRHALRILHAANDLQPDRRTVQRREIVVAPEREESPQPPNVTPEQISLIRSALDQLRRDPLRAADCYQRARHLLMEEQVRKMVPAAQRDREDVLAVWQYLDGQLDLGAVSQVICVLKRLRAKPLDPEPNQPEETPQQTLPTTEEPLSERERSIREAVLRLL